MANINIEFDTSEFDAAIEQLKSDIVNAAMDSGTDILNDMQHVAVDAAPMDTGNLMRCIDTTSEQHGDNFTGKVYISAYREYFDYGALRHDFPFNLGEGSLNKSPAVSNITGNSFGVGYNFAAGPAEQNADGYFKYIEELVFKEIANF